MGILNFYRYHTHTATGTNFVLGGVIFTDRECELIWEINMEKNKKMYIVLLANCNIRRNSVFAVNILKIIKNSIEMEMDTWFGWVVIAGGLLLWFGLVLKLAVSAHVSFLNLFWKSEWNLWGIWIKARKRFFKLTCFFWNLRKQMIRG